MITVKRVKKIVSPQWEEKKDTYSLGYVSSKDDEINIQFSITLTKGDFWLWEVYRIDLDRVVRMGKLKDRKAAEEVAIFWAIEEANFRLKEILHRERS